MLNKKILLSVLTIGVLAVVAGAGTWAAFTDTDTSEDNTFTAGTLILTVTQEIGDSDTLVPGDNLGDKTITVKNEGTIPISTVGLTFFVTDNALSNYITFTSVTFNGDTVMGEGTLSDLASISSFESETDIAVGDTADLVLVGCEFNEEAPNDCQGLSSILSVTFNSGL